VLDDCFIHHHDSNSHLVARLVFLPTLLAAVTVASHYLYDGSKRLTGTGYYATCVSGARRHGLGRSRSEVYITPCAWGQRPGTRGLAEPCHSARRSDSRDKTEGATGSTSAPLRSARATNMRGGKARRGVSAAQRTTAPARTRWPLARRDGRRRDIKLKTAFVDL
jgi:hypothetical protein